MHLIEKRLLIPIFDENYAEKVCITKASFLWILHEKTSQFNELQKLMALISRGVLTRQLRELEHDKLINRKIYREVSPKVEYSLTEIGMSFIPVIAQVIELGVAILKKQPALIWTYV